MPKTADPIEERAREIAATWRQAEDDRLLARARHLAARQLGAAKRTADRSDLTLCRREAARRGLALVADVWGAPVDPAMAFRPNPRTVYDAGGVHVITADGRTVFVCSPVVSIGARRCLVQAAEKWKPVDLPGTRQQPPSAQDDLQALANAGLRVGHGEVLLDRAAIDGRVPVATIALEWILGRGRGDAIICGPRPLMGLWDDRAAEGAAAVFAGWSSDKKQALGEAMRRNPAAPPRGRR